MVKSRKRKSAKRSCKRLPARRKAKSAKRKGKALPKQSRRSAARSDFAKQLRMGIRVEMEHTRSRKVAARIARQHLAEHPDYYVRLRKCFAGGHNPPLPTTPPGRSGFAARIAQNPDGLTPGQVSELALVSSVAGAAFIPSKLTLAKARSILRPTHVITKGESGEYRVAKKGRRERTEAAAYYTEDLRDAVQTALNLRRRGLNPRITGRYEHVDLMPGWKRKIDQRSIRTKTVRSHDGRWILLRIGCPKGFWMPRNERCKVGTRAISMLVPRGKRGRENNPRVRAGQGSVYDPVLVDISNPYTNARKSQLARVVKLPNAPSPGTFLRAVCVNNLRPRGGLAAARTRVAVSGGRSGAAFRPRAPGRDG